LPEVTVLDDIPEGEESPDPIIAQSPELQSPDDQVPVQNLEEMDDITKLSIKSVKIIDHDMLAEESKEEKVPTE